MSSYHSITDDFLRRNPPPNCITCGKPMMAVDDHGTFQCLTCDVFGGGLHEHRRRRANFTKVPNNEE